MRLKQWQSVCFAVAVAMALPCAAADKTFPKGTRAFDLSTRYTIGLERGREDIPSAAVGMHYFVFDNLSLGAEFAGYFVAQDREDTFGFGLSGVMRHHLKDWQSGTFFGDVSFGPFYAVDEVPVGGTHFNFITRVGLGVTQRLKDDTRLLAGVRWFHLSNAQIKGKDRNPSIDGVEIYLGLGWQW